MLPRSRRSSPRLLLLALLALSIAAFTTLPTTTATAAGAGEVPVLVEVGASAQAEVRGPCDASATTCCAGDACPFDNGVCCDGGFCCPQGSICLPRKKGSQDKQKCGVVAIDDKTATSALDGMRFADVQIDGTPKGISQEPTQVTFATKKAAAPVVVQWSDVDWNNLTPKEKAAADAARKEAAAVQANVDALRTQITLAKQAIDQQELDRVEVIKNQKDRDITKIKEDIDEIKLKLTDMKEKKEKLLADKEASVKKEKANEQAAKNKAEADAKTEQKAKDDARLKENSEKDLARMQQEQKAKMQDELDKFTKQRDDAVQTQMKISAEEEEANKAAVAAEKAKEKADESNAKKIATTKEQEDKKQLAATKAREKVEEGHKATVNKLKADETSKKAAEKAEVDLKRKTEDAHKKQMAVEEQERKADKKLQEADRKNSESATKAADKLIVAQEEAMKKRQNDKELADAAAVKAEAQAKDSQAKAKQADVAAEAAVKRTKAELDAAETDKKMAINNEARAKAQKNRDAANAAQEQTEKAEQASQRAELARQAAEQQNKKAEQELKLKEEQGVKARAKEEEASKEKIAAEKAAEATGKLKIQAEQKEKEQAKKAAEENAKALEVMVAESDRAYKKAKTAVDDCERAMKDAQAEIDTADAAQKRVDDAKDSDPPARASLAQVSAAKSTAAINSAKRASDAAAAAVSPADDAMLAAKKSTKEALIAQAQELVNRAARNQDQAFQLLQKIKSVAEIRTRDSAALDKLAKEHLQKMEEEDKNKKNAEADAKKLLKEQIASADKGRAAAMEAFAIGDAARTDAKTVLKTATDAGVAASAARTVAAYQTSVDRFKDAVAEIKAWASRADAALKAADEYVRLTDVTKQVELQTKAKSEREAFATLKTEAEKAQGPAEVRLKEETDSLTAAQKAAEQQEKAIARRKSDAIPRALPVSLPHKSYGQGARLPQFTRNDGICLLSGAIKLSSVADNTLIATVPKECAPAKTLVFVVVIGNARAARVDLYSDGKLRWIGGGMEGELLNLDGINYPSAEASPAPKPLTLNAGWTNYGDEFQTASYYLERELCFLGGVIRTTSGELTPWSDVLVDTLPEECRPIGTEPMYFSVNSHENMHLISVNARGEVRWVAGSKTRFWLSLSGISFPVTGNKMTVAKPLAPFSWASADATGFYRSGEMCSVIGNIRTETGNTTTKLMKIDAPCLPENGVLTFYTLDLTNAIRRIDLAQDGTVSLPQNVLPKNVALSLAGLRYTTATEQSWEKDGQVKLAADQEAERKAAEDAAREAALAARKAAVPTGIILGEDWEVYGEVYRAPQWARAGPFCIMSGLTRRLNNMRSIVGKSIPDSCGAGKPLEFNLLSSRVESVAAKLDAGSLAWTGGSTTGAWVSLDNVVFTTSEAKRVALELGKGVTAATGSSDAPSFSKDRALCALSGIISISGLTADDVKQDVVLFRIPPTCRPDKQIITSGSADNGATIRIDINADGTATWIHPSTNAMRVSLENILFPTTAPNALEGEGAWRPFGDPFRGPSYVKQDHFCVLSGLLYSNAGAVLVVTLPEECRPASGRLVFAVNNNEAVQRADVLPDGRVMFETGANKDKAGFLPLDGIRFMAAPAQDWEDKAVAAADKARAERELKARLAEEAEKNKAQEEANKKFQRDTTPTPIDVVASSPFVQYGNGTRLAQYAKTDGLCIFSGLLTVRPDLQVNDTTSGPVLKLNDDCVPTKPLSFARAARNASKVFAPQVVTVSPKGTIDVASPRVSFLTMSAVVVPRPTTKLNPLKVESPFATVDGAAPAAYFKEGDLCLLSGVVTPGTATGAQQITTLPAECIPDRTVSFLTAVSDGSLARVSIDNRGRVTVADDVAGKTLSLDGVFFYPANGTPLVLGEGWTQNGGSAPTARQQKTLCMLSGGVTGTSRVVGKVPAACKPASGRLGFVVLATDKPTLVEIDTDGSILWPAATDSADNTARFTLDGIAYMIADTQAWETQLAESIKADRARLADEADKAKKAYDLKWRLLRTPAPIELNNKFVPLGKGYRIPQFARYASFCILSGTSEGPTLQTIPAVLPPTCAPVGWEIYDINTADSTSTRWDVAPNGNVVWVKGGKGTQLSFDGVVITAADAEVKPAALALSKPWAAFGDKFGVPSVTRDGELCVLQGVVTGPYNATTGVFESTTIGKVTEDCRPRDGRLSFNVNHHTRGLRIDIAGDGTITIEAGEAVAPGVSLAGIAYFPASSGKLNFSAGWGTYGQEFRTPSYRVEGALCAVSGTILGEGAPLIATLPEECRPLSGRLSFTVNRGLFTSRVDVLPDGSMIWVGNELKKSWMSLDGIRFLVAPVADWEKTRAAEIQKEQDAAVAAKAEAMLKLAEPNELKLNYTTSGISFTWENMEQPYGRIPQFARYGDICIVSGVAVASVADGVTQTSNVVAKLSSLSADCRPASSLVVHTGHSHATMLPNAVVITGERTKFDGAGDVWVTLPRVKNGTRVYLSSVAFPIRGSKLLPLTLNNGWSPMVPDAAFNGNWDAPTAFVNDAMCVLNGYVANTNFGTSKTEQKAVFNFTGDTALFDVPEGTKGLHIKLWGASGGAGEFSNREYTSGAGGYTNIFVPRAVTNKGGQLKIRVGQAGGVSSKTAKDCKAAFPNGGVGQGGDGSVGCGGGRTEVYFDQTLLAVAGAGGGATGYGGHAGAGGGLRGENGYLTGRGASQEEGGQNGDKSGDKFKGGDGGFSPIDDGGAGGDGYYGGAGGGGDARAGGGGSGFVNSAIGVTGFSFAGYRSVPPGIDDVDYPGQNVAWGVNSEGRSGNPGFVVVRMDVSRGDAEWYDDAVITTLPEACRPDRTLVFNALSRRVVINADGTVVAPLHDASPISLTGISFMVRHAYNPLVLTKAKAVGGIYRVPSYTRKFQICMLSGLMEKVGSAILAVLPEECRPFGRLSFTTWSSHSVFERVDVLPNGHVVWPGWYDDKQLSLDGIYFLTGGKANWEVEAVSSYVAEVKKAEQVKVEAMQKQAAPTKLALLYDKNSYFGYNARSAQISRFGTACVMGGEIKTDDASKALTRTPVDCRASSMVIFDNHNTNTETIRFDMDADGTIKPNGGNAKSASISLEGWIFPTKDAVLSDIMLDPMWSPYGGDFGLTVGVSKQNDLCILAGVVKIKETTKLAQGVVIGTLPEDCRPAGGRLVFNANSNGDTHRVDVSDDGRLIWMSGNFNTNILSLYNIAFFTKSTGEMAMASGFTPYGGVFRTPSYRRDYTLCALSGVVRGMGATIATLPADCRPTGDLKFFVNHGLVSEAVVVHENGQITWTPPAGSTDETWLPLDGIRFIVVPESAWELTEERVWMEAWDKQVKEEGEKKAKADEAAEKRAQAAAERAAAQKKEADEKAAAAAEATAKAEKAAKAKEEGEKEEASKSGARMPLGSGVEPLGRGYDVPQFIKLSDSLCMLQGAAYAANVRTTVAKVPAECLNGVRNIYLSQLTRGIDTRMDMLADGSIAFQSGGGDINTGWVTFQGFSIIRKDVEIQDIRLNTPYYTNMGGEYNDATYVKDGELCVLQGTVKVNSYQGYIGKVNKDCAPSDGRLIFGLSNGQGNHYRVDILNTGEIYYVVTGEGGSNSGILSFSGMHYFTESAIKPLALVSGWSPYASGYRTPSYGKQDKVCLLSGLISGGQFGDIATVPNECRPTQRLIFVTNMHDLQQRIDITEEGRVIWVDGATRHGWLSLDGMMWAPSTFKLRVDIPDSVPLTVKELPYAQNWEAFGAPYRTPQYARFDNICLLSGVVKNTNDNMRTLIAKLPEECRPDEGTRVFDGHLAGTATARIDVSPTGKLFWNGGNDKGGWLSLDNVMFGVTGTRSEEVQVVYGMKNYLNGYASARWFLQGDLCVVSGLVFMASGNTFAGGVIATLPAECRPEDGRLIFNLNHQEYTHRVDVLQDGRIIYQTGGRVYAWISLDGISFMTNSQNTVALINNWQPFTSGYRPASYRKQGSLCVLSGMAQSGNSNTVLSLPAECRPNERLIFYTNNHGPVSRFDVLPDGRVIFTDGSRGQGWITLEGIKFIADKVPEPAAEPYAVVKGDNRKSLTLNDGIVNYQNTYDVASYRRAGPLCILSGLIDCGNKMERAWFQLPEECRPDGRLIFNTFTSGGRTTRFDVLPDGTVVWVAGYAGGGWVSLNGIQFLVKGSRRTNIQLFHQWMPYGEGFAPPTYTRMGGICFLSGLIRTDNYNTNQWNGNVGQLPRDCTPQDGRLILAVNHNDQTWRLDILNDGTMVLVDGVASQPWISLTGIQFHVVSADQPIQFAPGWVNYGEPYRRPSFKKEGNLCILSGLMNYNGGGELMFNLPSDCRPPGREIFSLDQDRYGSRIDVLPDGRVLFQGPRQRNWQPLDGIIFSTDSFKAVQTFDEPISKEGTALELKSGFRSFGDGFRNAIFTRVGPLCLLSGKITAADIRATITTLPATCRPANANVFDIHNGLTDSYGYTLRVDVTPNGDVRVTADTPNSQAANAGNYVPLDGIIFPVTGTKATEITLGQFQSTYRPMRGGFEVPSFVVYDDMCTVSGLMTTADKNSPPNMGNILQLPENCRPLEGRLIFPANHNGYTWRVDVDKDGWVSAQAGPRLFPLLSLNNILFFKRAGTALPLMSGWGRYGNGYREPSYKRIDNMCMLGGLLSGSRTGTITVLPEECRPMERLQFTVNNHDYTARVDIMPDGRVQMPNGNRYSWLPLDGIAFVVPKDRAESQYPVVDDVAKMKLLNLTLADGLEAYKRTYLLPEASVWGKLCMLGGVARASSDLQRTLANVPAECRPSGRLSFDRHVNKGEAAFRMDIFAEGDVAWAAGAFADEMFSFDGVIYPTKDAPQGNILLKSNWVAQGKGYKDPGWIRQGELCVLAGTARTDTNLVSQWDGGNFAQLPGDCRPDGQLIMNINHNENTHRYDITTSGDIVYQAMPTSGPQHPFIPLDGLAFMTKAGTSLTMKPGWGPYGNPFRVPSYRIQGDLCILSGLANGNNSPELVLLPEDCRPRGRLWFNLNHHIYTNRYDIYPTGLVEYQSGSRSWNWISLDGIRFIRKT